MNFFVYVWEVVALVSDMPFSVMPFLITYMERGRSLLDASFVPSSVLIISLPSALKLLLFDKHQMRIIFS